MGKKKDDFWGDDVGLDVKETESDWDDFDLGLGDGKKKKGLKKLKPMSMGRIIWVCFVAILCSGLMGGLGYVLYTNYITYPQREVVNYALTGSFCLDNWETVVKSMEVPFDDSYINKEIIYANGDENKIAFYKKMLATIDYHPYQVKARNVFGNDYIDKSTGSIQHIDSYVGVGEAVGMEVVDYDAINFNEYSDKIKSLMSEHELEFGDVNYENRLVSVFIDFMNWLPEDKIPTKVIKRVPYMDYTSFATNGSAYGGKFVINKNEDIYLDRLLFSSYQFYDCLDRFSLCASGTKLEENKEYTKWNKLSVEKKEFTERPEQYNYKQCCAKLWCGSYYLMNEHKVTDSQGNRYVSSVRAEIGDGSIENPLGLYTDTVTSVFFSERDDLGNIVSYESYPIRIELIEYGYSKDAIDYFESKDIRNRGIAIESDVQYCYMVFNVTNLSDKELTISENMGLCDINGNRQARTGIIYGLQGEVTLQPDETGIIETWQSSTSLWKKYVIWGDDFDRRENLVFFRLLAGDIENTDEFKGVTVNTTRGEDRE